MLPAPSTHLTAAVHGGLPGQPRLLCLHVGVPVVSVTLHQRLLQLPAVLLQFSHILLWHWFAPVGLHVCQCLQRTLKVPARLVRGLLQLRGHVIVTWSVCVCGRGLLSIAVSVSRHVPLVCLWRHSQPTDHKEMEEKERGTVPVRWQRNYAIFWGAVLFTYNYCFEKLVVQFNFY